MGIKDDPLCTFCKTHVQTTVHLLWDCSITKDFLKSFLSWLQSFHIHIELSEKPFLFGLVTEKKYQMSINSYYCMPNITSTVLAVTFIHQCLNRSREKYISCISCKIHMEIAYTNNNLDNFQNEWGPYEDLLNAINTH